jgi:hypothetical protein
MGPFDETGHGATELTSCSDPGLTRFKVGLYDDQPNTGQRVRPRPIVQ